MLATKTGLMGNVVGLRFDKMQVVLRPGHCHIHEPALFFDLLWLAGCVFVGEVSVRNIKQVNIVPLLPLRRMNRRKN